MKLHLPILWLLWAMLVLFLGSCSGEERGDKKLESGTSYYLPGQGSANLVTVEHDGHKWLVAGFHLDVSAPVHHPDCPCGKR
jgi:hypothetical protein